MAEIQCGMTRGRAEGELTAARRDEVAERDDEGREDGARTGAKRRVSRVRLTASSWMKSLDRSKASADAQFSALEAFLLLRQADESDEASQDKVEVLREALAAARALVVAANYALSQSADTRRAAACAASARPAPEHD
ncbi:hypothetical protein ACIQWZ_38555 [Streptomyces sp. NPDC098077]|uniref:hypothetical protein n=1 Tax=Streptomyces sp. NPDC098077 TaxID=3366093 RepID=UPI00382BC12B